jgi:hypothetical protein
VLRWTRGRRFQGGLTFVTIAAPGGDAGLLLLHLSGQPRLPRALRRLRGGQTARLAIPAGCVAAPWAAYQPVLDHRLEPHPYPAGTWGPPDLDQGVPLAAAPYGRLRPTRGRAERPRSPGSPPETGLPPPANRR